MDRAVSSSRWGGTCTGTVISPRVLPGACRNARPTACTTSTSESFGPAKMTPSSCGRLTPSDRHRALLTTASRSASGALRPRRVSARRAAGSAPAIDRAQTVRSVGQARPVDRRREGACLVDPPVERQDPGQAFAGRGEQRRWCIGAGPAAAVEHEHLVVGEQPGLDRRREGQAVCDGARRRRRRPSIAAWPSRRGRPRPRRRPRCAPGSRS